MHLKLVKPFPIYKLEIIRNFVTPSWLIYIKLWAFLIHLKHVNIYNLLTANTLSVTAVNYKYKTLTTLNESK